jgi:hypothetical protein
MVNSNAKKAAQLGMPFGTANGRLKKNILFSLVVRLGENTCFHCKEIIETVEEFSIEHKEPWQDNDPALFWDIGNIAFSHFACNVGQARKLPQSAEHGSSMMYARGCRCEACKTYKAGRNAVVRCNTILRRDGREV